MVMNCLVPYLLTCAACGHELPGALLTYLLVLADCLPYFQGRQSASTKHCHSILGSAKQEVLPAGPPSFEWSFCSCGQKSNSFDGTRP